MSIVVTARDVPEVRARMASWARDPGTDGAANWFTFWLGPYPEQATESRVFDLADDVSAIISGTLAAQLPAAELFYVSDDMTELAGHAATTLTDYRLHPEDLPAQVGVMVYAHPPVAETATDDHNGITAVSWGPGRGGLWVHTWATTTSAWTDGAARIGRVLASLPHDQVLARAIRGSQHPPRDTDADPPTTEQAADDFAAGLLPNLRRAPIPPSFLPAHGYSWRGLTPMEFTDMQGWPGYVPSNGEGMDADAKIALFATPMRLLERAWAMLVLAVDIVGDAEPDRAGEVELFAGSWLPEQPPADGLYDGDLVVRLTHPADPASALPGEDAADVEMLLAYEGRWQRVGQWRGVDERWPRVVAPTAAAVMGLHSDATEALARRDATPPPMKPVLRWARGGIGELLDAGLVTVGDELVWNRRNLGVAHTARVRADGTLVLADGRVYANPSGATTALGGNHQNGWSAFRRTSDGRTLGDLRTELRARHGR